MDTIISAQELAADLHQGAAPVILDVRYERGGPSGREAYEAGHIAGAVYVDLEADLAGPPGPGKAGIRCRTPACSKTRCGGPGCAGTAGWSSTTAARAGPRHGPGGSCAGPGTGRYGCWTAASPPGRPPEAN